MRSKPEMSAFDRIALVVVTLLGTCLEWMMMARAAYRTLTPILALIFPGCVIGIGVSKLVGQSMAEFVSGIANGAIYGIHSVWVGQASQQTLTASPTNLNPIFVRSHSTRLCFRASIPAGEQSDRD